MKILTVVGARPQFVKAAVVSRALRHHPGIDEVIVHTGQHYDPDMSDRFFADLGIPEPKVNLEVGSGSHGRTTGAMLAQLDELIVAERPDWLLVYGDTNSTLAGALAAAKLHIPVAHVEAGLRSFNRRMPEEINRVLTDHLSQVLFAPTEAAVRNLEAEGIRGDAVVLAGDVMFDAVRHFRQGLDDGPILARYGLPRKGFALATVHRAENTDEPGRLANIADGLRRLARRRPVIWPVHPRTAKSLAAVGLTPNATVDGLTLTGPIGYLEMIALAGAADLIATDSGGVQKEAFFLGVPCVTLRTETEWVELVACGANRLADPRDPGQIEAALEAKATFPDPTPSPYGDGHAGEVIARWFAAS